MKKRKFHINGQYYEIPETDVQSFLTDNPKAQEVKYYSVNGSDYNIPIHEVDSFENEMGLKKKETPSQVSGIGSSIGGMVGASKVQSEKGTKISGGATATFGSPKDVNIKSAASGLMSADDGMGQVLEPIHVDEIEDPEDPAKSILNSYDKAIEKNKSSLNGVYYREGIPINSKGVVSNVGEVHKNISNLQNEQDSKISNLITTNKKANEWLYKQGKTIDENNVTDRIAINVKQQRQAWDQADNPSLRFDDVVASVNGVNPKDIPEAKMGQIVDAELSNPLVIEKAKEDANFHNKYQQAKFDLYNNYPAYAFKKVGEMISQKLEDNRMTGWLYANPSLSKVEKAIDMLKEDGKWTDQEQRVFDERMKPIIAIGGADKVLKLTDAAHQFGYGVYEGAKGFDASGRDLINKLTGSFLDSKGNGLFQNLGLMENNEDRDKRLAEEQANEVQVKPTRGVTKFLGGASNFAGQMTPLILGEMAGIPSKVNMTMMFEGRNADDARTVSKNPGVQNIYTLLTTAGDVFGAEFLPTKKASEGFKKLMKPEVANLVRNLSDKKITEEVAQKTFVDKAMDYAGKFIGTNTQTANVLSAYNLFHRTAKAAFGAKDVGQKNMIDETFENYPTNWLSSSFLSGFSTIGGERSEPINGQMYKRIADNADHYRELTQNDKQLSPTEKQDRLEKIDHLEGINNILEKQKYPADKAEKFLDLSMKQFVAEKAAKEMGDKVLAKEDERKAKIAEVEKEHLLNPMTNTELLENLYDHLPKVNRNMLSTDGKFDENKVGDYLKVVFQQAHNLDADFKPYEGKAPSVDEIPESILQAAEERWKDKLPKEEEPIFSEQQGGGQKPPEDQLPVSSSGVKKGFTAKEGNKVVDENGEPLTLYHSTFNEPRPFEDGINYFAEDKQYSQDIAKTLAPKGADYVEKPVNTIPVNIKAERIYELPKGTEMNGNVIKSLLKEDPNFKDKYDAVKGIDLYSDNKTVYAVFDKSKIKEVSPKKESKVSVIMPEENKKPDIVELKKAENQQTDNKEINPENDKPEPPSEVPPIETAPNENSKGSGEEPPTGEAKVLVEGDDGNVTGVKRSITKPLRHERGLPKVDLPKMGSDSESLQKAKERVDSGESNPRELVNRILNDNEGYRNEDDVFDMQYYAHQLGKEADNLSQQLADAKTEAQDADIRGKQQQLSDEIDQQTEAAIRAGNKWHKVGEGMQVVIDAGFNPSREKVFIKDAYGGEIPEHISRQLDELTKTINENKATMAKLEKENNDLKAQKELNKSKSKKRKDKTDDDFVADRKKYIQELKDAKAKHEQWLKDNGIQKKGVGFTLTTDMIKAIGKIVKSYAEQGLNKIEEVASKIYDDIKDVFDGIEKKDVIDIIAGKYNQSAQRSDLAKQVAEIRKQAKQVSDANLTNDEKTKNEIDRLNKKADNIENNIPKSTKEPFNPIRNNEWVKANQRVFNAEYKIKKLKAEAFQSQKNMLQKGMMWGSKLVRGSILSGTNVLYKLAAAAAIGGAGKRIPEQAFGTIWSNIYKGIARKAPIEGFVNAKAELKFYKEFFNPKKFLKNTWQIASTHSSNLGKKFGETFYDDMAEITMPGKRTTTVGKVAKTALNVVDRALTFPLDVHQMIKDPIKRATYEASLYNGMVWAEKQGYDIHDPLIKNTMEVAAYKRANYEIFQEKRWLSKKFNQWKSNLEKQGTAGSAAKLLVDFMIPVSTVPTNIAARMLSTSPLGMIRGQAMVINAYRKGIESLKPEQADAVMRQLKQGSLGTALWLIGWFGASHFGGLYSQYNPNKKRDEGELSSDQMEVNGTMIPKPVQHAIPFEVMQMAATTRHIYDNYKEGGSSDVEALISGALGALGSVAEQIPVIETPMHVAGALKNPYEAVKLKEDIKRRVVPQILKETGVVGNKSSSNSQTQHPHKLKVPTHKPKAVAN